ncbi:MAG: thiamine-monophosphate kinase [Planctomycetes bacterium]|nr:thiamine-monophosphate kinase [Planctomycetota bacterium]
MSQTMGELQYIDWLRKRTPPDPRVLLGPGDDTAILRAPAAGQWLATTDMLLEGTHFRLGEVSARQVGRKALAVNLSDIAAMAGRPVAALVSLGLPQSGASLAEEVYLGLREMADAFQTAIVGGDTNAWNGGLVVSVTLLGEVSERGAVTRGGARPGDWLLVTGPLGGSILGKHLDFTPRVREALELHRHADLHAMIDISDGLAADVGHLCEESRCGVVLRAADIPISDAAQQLRDGKSALDHALGDGEDFELAFAVSAADGAKLLREQPIAGVRVSRVGEFVADTGMWLEDDGKRRPLAARGFQHQLS